MDKAGRYMQGVGVMSMDGATCFDCIHCEMADWDIYDEDGDEIDTGGVCLVRSEFGVPFAVGCFTQKACELFAEK